MNLISGVRMLTRGLRQYVALVATLLALGLVLFVVYAIKEGFWHRPPITSLTLCFIVGATVLAGLLLALLDAHSQRCREKRERLTPSVELTGLAKVCAEGYAATGRFCARQVRPQVGGSEALQAVMLLEDRTWDYHRAIVIAHADAGMTPDSALQKEIREWCGEVMRPSRFRGLGVGIIVEDVGGKVPHADQLFALVDCRSKTPATLQWVVWYNRASGHASAAHMFIEGRTAPCFVACCRELAREGITVDLKVREPEGLVALILRVHRRIPWWVHVLGP